MPPIDSRAKASPKDFFLYLAAIVTLYVSTWSILRLLFEIIDYTFPDRLSSYIDPYSTSIRLAIASLVIIFPVYLIISRYLRVNVAREPAKRELGIRKALVYLTLFLAGAIIIGDLVTLINTFLGGEITMRFVLKVVAVLIVTGGIFGYYGLDLRRKDGLSAKAAKIFASVTSVFIIASIVVGFFVMGSPSSIRQVKFDQTRVDDLQSIQDQAVNYWQQKRVLPTVLADLNNPLQNFTVPTDPETGAAYDYIPTSDLAFKLCAVFGAESSNSGNLRGMSVPVPAGVKGEESWQHGTSKVCFDRTIDPQLYPPATTINAKPAR